MIPRRSIILAVGAALSVAAVSPGASQTDPYELEKGREVALVGASAAIFGAGWLAERDRAPLGDAEIAALDPAGLNALDRSAIRRWSPSADRASDVLVVALTAAPVVQMVAGPGREYGGRLALIYGETMLLTGATTYALKSLVARPRPFLYNDDPRIPADLKRSASARHSWPSGHTANAFASMVFFAATFEHLQPDSSARGWVWGGCLTAAAATGVLRYAAGRHYPTDILAGALIGAAAGWLVPRWHEAGADSQGAGAPVSFAVRVGF